MNLFIFNKRNYLDLCNLHTGGSKKSKLQKNKLRSTVLEGDDYYGKKVSNDKIEINLPAPSGSITIIDTGQAIIISI